MLGNKTRSLILAGTAMLTLPLLSACGGGGDARPPAAPDPGPGLIYSYPLDGQHAVPTGADIVLKMGRPANPEHYRLVQGSLRGPTVGGPPQRLGDGDILRFDPAERLAADAVYRVVFQPTDDIDSRQELLRFETQLAGAETDETLAVVEQVGGDFPFVTFTTLRLRFNKPVIESSVVLGDSFKMLDPEGNQVPGTLRVNADKLVFDPHRDLVAGDAYEVRLSTDITSTDGRRLPVETSFTLRPMDPGIRAVTDGATCRVEGRPTDRCQRMKLSPSRFADGGEAPISDLVGQELNTMVLESNLIGRNQLGVGGTLDVIVANPGNFDGMIPFTIPKGQLIAAEPLVVGLGGEIPAGLESAEMVTEFLTDANGYFISNPYDEEGPIMAVVFMELGVSATDGISSEYDLEQGAMNTEILQVRATGTLEIEEGGIMLSEVFGAMDIDILGGTDKGSIAFSMMMHGPAQDEPLEPRPVPMKVVSTYPNSSDEGIAFMAVDDTIVVNFSSALDADSVSKDDISLYETNTNGVTTQVDYRLRVHGGSLLIDPVRPLRYGAEYQLDIGADIRSIAGVPYDGAYPSVTWHMPSYSVEDPPYAPQLMSLRPGVPCALVGGDWESGGNSAGRCDNGPGGPTDETTFDVFLARGADVIEAHFTKPMNKNTLVMAPACPDAYNAEEGEEEDPNVSIRIERIDEEGVCQEAVAGLLRVGERSFTFVPDRPWQNDQLYRLTLISERIEDERDGLALNSNPLAGPDGDQGDEPNVVIPFRGAPSDGYTLQPLAPRPFADINGDFQLSGEMNTSDDIAEGYASTEIRVASTEGPVQARIIDPLPSDHSRGYMYMNYTLMNEIGQLERDDEGRPRIPVRVTAQFQQQTSTTLEADYQLFDVLDALGLLDALGVRFLLDLLGITNLTNITATSITNQTLIRPATGPEGHVVGYITEHPDPEVGGAYFSVDMPLYVDAPYMEMSAPIDTGIEPRDLLRSKRIHLRLEGPIYNLPDGRIALHLENQNTAEIQVEVQPSLPGLNIPLTPGYINLEIPRNGVKLELIGPPLKGFNQILGAAR